MPRLKGGVPAKGAPFFLFCCLSHLSGSRLNLYYVWRNGFNPVRLKLAVEVLSGRVHLYCRAVSCKGWRMWSASRVLQVVLLIWPLFLFTACPSVGPPQPVDQREALIALTLRGLGGFVRTDEKGRVNEVNLARTGVRDEDLLLLEELPYLRMLSLAHTRITPSGLQHLRDLRQLRTLNLYKTTDFKSVDALREAMSWCTITD